MNDQWNLRSAALSSVSTDPRTRETRLVFDGPSAADGQMVMRGTRAVRCPDPLPRGSWAEVVGMSRVSTEVAAILTLWLRSGDTVQIAGSGLLVQ